MGARHPGGLGANKQMTSITVPAKTLAIRNYNKPAAEGEEAEMVQPMAGDPVDFSVRGSVSSIEGDTATVNVAFVNGERVEAAAAPEQPEEEAEAAPPELNEDDVRTMAEAADRDSDSDYI